jgi:magnesium-transporting ATPase (P-type)
MLFKNHFQIVFIIFTTIISVLIATFLWDLIHFKIPNLEKLGRGQYIENNYNQSNEILRYLIFILLPLVTFLTLMICSKKILIREFFSQLQSTNDKDIFITEDFMPASSPLCSLINSTL